MTLSNEATLEEGRNTKVDGVAQVNEHVSDVCLFWDGVGEEGGDDDGGCGCNDDEDAAAAAAADDDDDEEEKDAASLDKLPNTFFGPSVARSVGESFFRSLSCLPTPGLRGVRCEV